MTFIHSRSVRFATVSTLLVALSACASTNQQPPSGRADLVLEHVNVVDVRSGRIVRDQTVAIAGDSIQSIAPAKRSRVSAATVLNGRGQYLIPGLFDMHAHIRGNGVPAFVSTDWMMPLNIANGVTGVRDMTSECDGAPQGPVCLPQMRAWRAQLDQGQLLGPRFLSLSSFQVNPPWTFVMSETQARNSVQRFKRDSVDLIKIYTRLSKEAFGWFMDEAAKQGIRAAGHVPLRVTISEASERGFRSVEHARDFLFDCFPGSADFRATARSQDVPPALMRTMVNEYSATICASVFRTMVRHDTWYVPTHLTRRMEAFAHDSTMLTDPRLRFLPVPMKTSWLRDATNTVALDSSRAGRQAYMDFYKKGLEITGAAFKAGVGVLVGTDAGDSFAFPGSGVHDELVELVAAGLSPAQALRAATLSGAEFLGISARFGAVENGKRADLVLLSANPLERIENVRRIDAVIFRGQLLNRARLDSLLAHAEATAKRDWK